MLGSAGGTIDVPVSVQCPMAANLHLLMTACVMAYNVACSTFILCYTVYASCRDAR